MPYKTSPQDTTRRRSARGRRRFGGGYGRSGCHRGGRCYRYEPVERFTPSGMPSDFANMSAGLTLLALFAPVVAGVAGFLVARWTFRLALRALRRDASDLRRQAFAAAERAQKAMRVVHRASRREPPSRELLLRCWDLSRTSLEGKILLGSLLGDVDAVEDHSYIRGEGGEIAGRRGGVRRWLEATSPSLMKHYKTLMRYKAMADKFRRVCGLEDPDGAEDALAAAVAAASAIPDLKSRISAFAEIDTRKVRDWLPATPETRLAAARKKARKLLAEHRTLKALDDALWAALGLVRMRRRPAAA